MKVEVAIIGSGFSGINMAINLIKSKIDSFVIFEKSADIGGVWRDNVYPGCTCDIKSVLYSLKSEPNPNWTSNFPKQREIHSYIHSIVGKYNLKDHIKLNTEVTKLHFDEVEGGWKINTKDKTHSAQVVILATGPQRLADFAAIDGMANFRKSSFHSSQWDGSVDLKERKVAIIGSGASSIQIVPAIQPLVAKLFFFQRTPAWILPRMQRNTFKWERKFYKTFPFVFKIKREINFWLYEFIGTSFIFNKVLHKALRLLCLARLKFIVDDKVLRAKLTPNYELGCKRILVSDEFYQVMKKGNVSLITEPIVLVKDSSIQTDLAEYDVDVIIYATGFKVADIEQYIEIKGMDSLSLNEVWEKNGAEAFLGTHITGFPNLGYLLGPNSGLSHSSALHAMESQVNLLIKYLKYLKKQPKGTFLNVKPEVQKTYNEKLQQQLKGTIWDSGCTSWFINKKNKNTVIFPGSLFTFRKRTKRFDVQNYNIVKL